MQFKKSLSALLLAALVASPFAVAKTVQDIQGNQIELPDNVQRVADLWPANNQVVLLLGGADKLVGTVTPIKTNPWFAEVFPKIKDVPALTKGADVNVESLLAQNPDVVLMSSKAMLDTVQQAGVKGVLVQFQDFNGLKNTVRITANVLGDNAPQIAETYIKELEQNIAFVAERIKNVPADQRPTVLHISNANNLNKIDGGKSIVGEWINLAGGKSAFADQANLVEVNVEDILKQNPDIIIIGSQDAAKGVEKIKNDPTWQGLQAVKNQRVYVNPMGTFPWDRYSAEEALQVLWAAKLFHPEIFKDVDLVKKTQDFYQKYYHYQLSKENAERILTGQAPVETK